MWDEDPRCHEANYRFLQWMAGLIVAVAVLSSLVTGEWDGILYCLVVFAVVGSALGIYAATVWILFRGVLLLTKIWRKATRRDSDKKATRS